MYPPRIRSSLLSRNRNGRPKIHVKPFKRIFDYSEYKLTFIKLIPPNMYKLDKLRMQNIK